MPVEPGTLTPEEVMAKKMAELDKMKADLTADRQRMEADRTNTSELNQTMASLTNVLNRANQPAPEPEPELEGEYDEATLRAAATIAKKQLQAYHNEIAPRLDRNDAAQFESEWARAKADDPKNFGRMETVMRKHFDTNPELKQPGSVDTLFTQMKGMHYNKLQEMDRADRQKEVDTPDPAPTSDYSDANVKKGDDTLSEDEWNFIRGLNRGITDSALQTHPEHYFLSKHGRYPEFEDNYIESRGYEKVKRGA